MHGRRSSQRQWEKKRPKGGGGLALMLKEEVGRGSRTSCTALGRVAQQRRRQGDSSTAVGPAR
jgi:hypothetical protein